MRLEMIWKSIKTSLVGNDQWALISLGLLNILSIVYIFTLGGMFFRDFSIVFEGGLRILYGQIPFRDFFLPSGPVVYYMQALFHWLCGENASAMLLHASIVNIICLSCLYCFIYVLYHFIPVYIILYKFILFYISLYQFISFYTILYDSKIILLELLS